MNIDLILIMIADHYLEICTNKGCCWVPIRVKDAVAKHHGIRIHRSHWVIFMAIVKIIKQNFLLVKDEILHLISSSHLLDQKVDILFLSAETVLYFCFAIFRRNISLMGLIQKIRCGNFLFTFGNISQ